MSKKKELPPVEIINDEGGYLPESALRFLIEFMNAHKEEIEEGMRRENINV